MSKDRKLPLRARLRPYKTIHSLREANRNQFVMIESGRAALGKDKVTIRDLQARVKAFDEALYEVTKDYMKEVQAGNDLAAENSELRRKMDTIRSKAITDVTSARNLGYEAGLHQGHFDAWIDDMPSCPHCGAGRPGLPWHDKVKGRPCPNDPELNRG